MTSFVKKTFLLAVSLVCFIHFYAAHAASYVTVTGVPVPSNTKALPRLEISELAKDSMSFNLYLLALINLQTTSTTQSLSYYRISAIHGTNLKWNGDTGGNFPSGYGYCHHADKLFPTWHRPYMALYEQTLYNIMVKIVNGFPTGKEKNAALAAVTKFRIPYWDWVKNSTLPDFMGTGNGCQNITVRMAQNGAFKNVSTNNPLCWYRLQKFNDSNTRVAGTANNGPQTVGTVRNPYVSNNNVYVSNNTFTRMSLAQVGSSLQYYVVQAFSSSTDYNSFSNMADGANSIEGPHGSVHVYAGGNYGHMLYPTYAGFDPLFYLHHANVDRLVALWQAIYPNSYLSSNTSDSPNQYTPLNPFRKTQTVYWTSESARNVTAFQYTYPELMNCNFDQSCVTATFNQMYGGAIPTQNSATSSTGKRKRALTDPSSDTIKTKASTIYDDYQALIKISNAAANGSFIVHIFFGVPPSDETTYTTCPNYVGAFPVFARENLACPHKKLVQGTVTLTTALHKLVDTKKLKDLTLDTLKTYLKGNFNWKITAQQSCSFDLTGFEIIIATAKVTVSSSECVLPVWGPFSTIYQPV